MQEESKWLQNLKMQRVRKDKFFKNDEKSPLPEDEKEEFDGLDYFEPNPDLRFELELNEFDEKNPIEVNDTAGNVRDMLVWGEFNFQIDDCDCTLQAYKSRVGEERLFVPYKDETNGQESYGAGRYLDLYYDRHQTKEGKWLLDFNRSTLPWCAFSEKYACPYVPQENWLEVEIRAGEKNYEH